MLRFSGRLPATVADAVFNYMKTIVLSMRATESLLLSLRRECRQAAMLWTPNKITLLRVVVGFLAVSFFGRSPWMNLMAVALTVATIALDALDGQIARKKRMATPAGVQIDILGDRIIENMYLTYFAVVGMVSLWLPMFFFARGAATDFLRTLVLRAGHSGLGANVILQTRWAHAIVAPRWSRGAYAALKCMCFCYLGLALALTRGPVAVLGPITVDVHDAIRAGAETLAWLTAAFCLLRGLPLLLEGWKYFAAKLPRDPGSGQPQGGLA
jgi:phosphatidylglycerophosphate synthase